MWFTLNSLTLFELPFFFSLCNVILLVLDPPVLRLRVQHISPGRSDNLAWLLFNILLSALTFVLQMWRSHSAVGPVHAVSSQGICNCWRVCVCVCVLLLCECMSRQKESFSAVLLLNRSLNVNKPPSGEKSDFSRFLSDYWEDCQ